jgi:hypothetical protein
MYIKNFKKNIFRNLSNIPGWCTSKKIVVFESDDWGSIRMSSVENFNGLKLKGIDETKNHYNLFDSLESNDDIELLFELLSKYKDKNNQHPVFTGVTIVGNPDFEKIKMNNFQQYYYEPFTETLKKYPKHDRVFGMLKNGYSNRLFVPVFHGREHLNVKRWMTALKSNNKSIQTAFDYKVTGISKGINGEKIPNLQAAFDIDKPEDVYDLESILTTGLELFKNLYGFNSEYFVPTNGPFNNSLEKLISDLGVQFINTSKIQIEPLGNGQYKKNIRFIGQKNSFNQVYITRNCFFEPVSMEYPSNTDWVNNCLKEIETAFKWNKPAIISTHRVNYTGFLYPENRAKGLKQLSELITRILKLWPNVEFMTSVELGNLINKK